MILLKEKKNLQIEKIKFFWNLAYKNLIKWLWSKKKHSSKFSPLLVLTNSKGFSNSLMDFQDFFGLSTLKKKSMWENKSARIWKRDENLAILEFVKIRGFVTQSEQCVRVWEEKLLGFSRKLWRWCFFEISDKNNFKENQLKKERKKFSVFFRTLNLSILSFFYFSYDFNFITSFFSKISWKLLFLVLEFLRFEIQKRPTFFFWEFVKISDWNLKNEKTISKYMFCLL